MAWYAYVLQFVSGMLLTNGIPHFVAGLMGSRFQSPFAKPPGVGESSALLNVYWGFANLAGGAVLLARFSPASALGWVVLSGGVLFIGTGLARHFSKVRSPGK